MAASGDPHADSKLMEILNWLRQADGYAYDLTITSAMKMNAKDTSVQHSTIYSSNVSFVRYASSAEEGSFMNSDGMYKINHRKKQIGYVQFESDTIVRNAKAAALAVDAGKLLDSVLVRHAVLSSKKKVGNLLRYKLSYEAGYMVRSLDLVFDERQGKLVSLSYVLERYLNGVKREDAILRQEVVMSGYTHSLPVAVVGILDESKDLKKYLNSKYAGYTVQKL